MQILHSVGTVYQARNINQGEKWIIKLYYTKYLGRKLGSELTEMGNPNPGLILSKHAM